MSVGQGSIVSTESYLGLGRETTYGTLVTSTVGLPFISASMKVMQEGKILEQIEASRTYSQHLRLGRVVEGAIDGYFYPRLTGTSWLLQNAFGGTVTSATATGESTGASNPSYTHTFNIGAMNQSFPSLSINLRKGDATSAKIFEYSGTRINELSFTAELDEALKFSASVVCKDATKSADDISADMTLSAMAPLSFVNGRVSVEGTLASLTSSSFWHVQSVSFGIVNNLKSDSESRRIGTDTLDVLPPGIANLPLSVTMRFDTTTAYDAMLASTQFSVELEFLGNTMSGSVIREGIKFVYPNVQINDAGDPEIGGPDEILTSEVTFNVLRDNTSATGYAIRGLLTNNAATI